MPRLFVAVALPPDVLAIVEALDRPPIEGLRWTDREQWHVTLRFLGAVDDPETVVAALRTVRASPRHATLGPAVARFGQRVLQLPVAGLDDVAAAVADATAALGAPPEDRPFAGHLTLARVRGKRRVDLRPLTGAEVSASWPVDDVVLFESHLHPKGARYEVLERFPLA
jgi:RNA 2',3'-cyclic 3'-phosphodiesterase